MLSEKRRSVLQDPARTHVAHHEVGLGGALDFDAVGGGGVDEAEHAAFQVHVHDDAHVPDFADVVPGAEEDEVALAQVGEAFDRDAVPELHHGVVGQVVSEFPEDVAGEARAVEAVGTRGTEPVGDADKGFGVVQELVNQFPGRFGKRDDAAGSADAFIRFRDGNAGADQVDGIHHGLRPGPRAGDIGGIREGRNDGCIGLLHGRSVPRDATRNDRQEGQQEDSASFHACKVRKILPFCKNQARSSLSLPGIYHKP